MERPLDRPQAELLCADLESVDLAIEVGADRIELCAAPEVGGLTPGAGLLDAAVEAVGGRLGVVALVRPRVGGFQLRGPRELGALVADVRAARAAGACGVAVGALRSDGALDVEAMAEVLSAAEGMAVTLHRAIDLTPDPVATLEIAAGLGVSRVLTSGAAATALEGAETIKALVEAARARVEVIAASGVRGANAAEVLRRTAAGALHGSCAGAVVDAPGLGMGALRPMDPSEAAGLVAAVRAAGPER
ncbi:MAG: copper homeostasis protein CutC [Planctomycetota bacterium]|nr:copper homeostasis protein CutC [Planctomycetota bacterium]